MDASKGSCVPCLSEGTSWRCRRSGGTRSTESRLFSSNCDDRTDFKNVADLGHEVKFLLGSIESIRFQPPRIQLGLFANRLWVFRPGRLRQTLRQCCVPLSPHFIKVDAGFTEVLMTTATGDEFFRCPACLDSKTRFGDLIPCR